MPVNIERLGGLRREGSTITKKRLWALMKRRFGWRDDVDGVMTLKCHLLKS